MKVQQLSVFIENQAGRLADVTGVLARAEISIRALSLADTQDFGILRLIVDDTQRARVVLDEQDFTVGLTDVVAVEIPDVPGGLNGVLKIFDSCDINVEYMYAFVDRNRENNAIVIFRIEDVEDGISRLQAEGVNFVEPAVLYGM